MATAQEAIEKFAKACDGLISEAEFEAWMVAQDNEPEIRQAILTAILNAPKQSQRY